MNTSGKINDQVQNCMGGKIEIKEITEIINERKFIDDILATGYIDQVNTGKILVKLAKHYYWDLGYKQTRTVKALDAYMIAHYPNYNEHTMQKLDRHGINEWERLFKRCYKAAIKTPIIEVEGIWITKTELEKIAELNNKVLERLTFVMLCYAKLYKARNPLSTGWVYSNKYKDIFKQARISCKADDRICMLGELADKGYLYEYQLPPLEKIKKMNPYQIERFNNRQLDMRVTFMDDESEKIIFVDDWRELGYYYRRYKGENIIRCAKCGKLERGNKNGTKKYCKQCTGNKSSYEYDYKQCQCVDCGKMFNVLKTERSRKRCPDCEKAERKEHNRQMYLKRKNSTILAKDEV